ncbi:hypothetical protein [Pengzhenrongella frigida]|uniref:Uncharacterized protein n=1 Tax=Pengzhenrongella frigida TaxID=1259133 RepID=A0A4Q5N403_9MICO|nr:hypothetical protein [Cellulomonas sp. HLT2-17]RYV52013.1 hypothetical protein EUA98_05440 [Cellulomonas sp. HLT2-17]
MPGPAPSAPASRRLQATTVARRLGRVLRFGAPSGWYGAPAVADGWWPPPPVAVVAAGRRDGLPAELRSRYDDLLAGARPHDDVRAVLERVFAAGASLDAVAFLAATWPELTDRDRAQVAAPLRPVGRARELRLAEAPAQQMDPTTCGSAVLGMLAASGDPLLALWLVTGRRMPTARPWWLGTRAVADDVATDAASRFVGLQLAVRRASNRSALGPLSWPAGLGTPPWGAARAAVFPGATFRSVMIDDTDTRGLRALLGRAERALAAGVGVPLFTGGDLGGGVAAAVPRHVVLLTPAATPPGPGEVGPESGRYTVYEPSSGAVHAVTRAELLAPDGARAALGGWSHACWAVLPGA